MKARYNYRIYPKPHQIKPLAKAFGCARVVWNDALWLYKKHYGRQGVEETSTQRPYQETGSRPKSVSNIVLTHAKKTRPREWLSEVSSVVLQQSLRDLETAWKNYFSSLKGKRKGKQVGRPKFKKKSSRQAIRFTTNAFSVHSNSVKLAKIGHIKTVFSRPLPSAPSSVTIIKDTVGNYFASFVVETAQPIPPQTEASCGIDLGLIDFAILSTSEKIENPRWHKKMLSRIKRASRKLAKAKKDSNRRKRRKQKLAKLHAKVKNQRADFLHKLTTRLVREFKYIAVEDLNVSGLLKNHKLARAIADAGWHKFKSMLEAKCNKYDRHLTIVNRWYASTQICSCCGKSGGKKELNVREWSCLFCNTKHDRDINSSRNLEQQIKKEAGGQSDSEGVHKLRGKPTQTTPHINERGASVSRSVTAVCVEPLTTYEQLSLF